MPPHETDFGLFIWPHGNEVIRSVNRVVSVYLSILDVRNSCIGLSTRTSQNVRDTKFHSNESDGSEEQVRYVRLRGRPGGLMRGVQYGRRRRRFSLKNHSGIDR